MAAPNKASEKRKHNRQDTHVEAVLTIGDNLSSECAILDFSEQGLFLRLDESDALAKQKDKTTKIYFSVDTPEGKEFFQIDGQVARIVDDGVGVMFNNLSEPMLEALKKTAGEGTISGYSKDPGVFLTSSTQGRFKEALQGLLQVKLPPLIKRFFEVANEELEQAPEFAENFTDIAAQENLAGILRVGKERLGKAFCLAASSNLNFTSDKDESLDSALETNLSLVEKNSFEDWLSFSSVVRKINSQYKTQLYQLELKLSYVTCFPRYLIRNPLGPERLCEEFRDEIATIEESVSAKKTLYKAFQITLLEQLPALYQAFDTLLVEYGAPKDFARDIVWKKNFPTGAKATGHAAPGFASGQPMLPSFDNESYHYPESYQHDGMATYMPERPAYYQPVTQTASRLFNLINQATMPGQSAPHPPTVPGNGSDPGGHDGGQVYSPDELLNALAKLQATKSLQQLPQNASALLQEQLQNVSVSQAHLGESKALSTEDKSKLDVYDQLFQALINQAILSPSIKSYLENLKLPLMSLSLQDANFMDSEDHPARNLLNQLYALDTAIKDNRVVKNRKTQQLLDQLVTRIAQGSIDNPDIFAKANEELTELTLPILKSKEINVRRVIEIYEGKQKLERARQKVQRDIDDRLAGKAIPSVLQLLLDSGWQHLLVMAELDEDDGDHKRKKYMETLDNLMAWYENRDKLPIKQLHQIELELAEISTTLETVCTNAFLHGKVMEELKATLLGSGKPVVLKPVEYVEVERKSPDENSEQEFITDSWLLQVNQFEPGDWFTFSLEKEAFEPLKLVWVGEMPPVYVFVNRDGYKKQEFNRKELAELLATGAVTKIENLDEPLMDRATTSMLQQMQEKLIHSVSHDPVTNLPNRKRFINLVKEYVANTGEATHVLGYLDIEDFRVITNICGLEGGDQLLQTIAHLLSKDLGEGGIVARLGDKTFGLLLKNNNADEGYESAKNIRNLINKSNFVWDDKSYTISVSIGLAPVLPGLSNVEELLQKADSANISAKRAGHNTIRVFKEDDETLKRQTDIHEWAGRIDRIFSENRLFTRCQMIAPIDPDKNSHTHYEILLGVKDETGNTIPPDKFIPAVERCERMPEVDRWIVENVFNWIVQNRESFDKIGGFAINLSGQSLNSEEFLTFLKDRLAIQDVPAEKITFEVTETVAAGNLAFTKRFIKEIKQFGCKFSLDDFGTGYSSYSYLKSLDVDYLKIDGSFIKDITNSQTDVVMVNSMNEIAHSLELQTIAEYVENMDIHKVLKDIGVDYAQGWGIHKPTVLTELAGILMAQPAPTHSKPELIETSPSDDLLGDFFGF